MAQFDVYRNPNIDARPSVPYLLDIQSELLESLSTRIVVPMVLAPPAVRLHFADHLAGQALAA